MPTTLEDHTFEILPSEEASAGFVFGIGTGDVSVETFDPGENDWIVQDGQNSRRGGRSFGRDALNGKTWAWESHTDQEDVETAVEVLDRFSAAWVNETLAETTGAVTSLRYKVAGRTRRVFGRPRRYAAPPTNLILNGYVPISHDFETNSAFTYDDLESQLSVPFESEADGGGFILPAVLPIQLNASTDTGVDQVSVSGSARAFPRIRFNGPWTNPSLRTDDWEIELSGSIAAGKWIEVDARPWKLTVLNQDGANKVEMLNRRTWLEDIWFAPQTQPQIRLGGNAGTNASCLVAWRNTWTSI